MSNFLDGLPPEARAVIVDELTLRDAALLEELKSRTEPTAEQRSALERVLAAAVIGNTGDDWAPNERGQAAERAIDAVVKTWPISDP